MSILKRIQGGAPGTPSGAPGGEQRNTTGSGNVPPRRVSAPSIPSAQDTYQDLKNRVQHKLLAGLDPSTDP
jgi:pilus assembly protein CpaF